MGEAVVPLSFVMWLLGFLVTLLGGCWAIFKYFESKLNRVYLRMDENKKQYYETFVQQKVYDAEQRLKKENVDGKFESVIELFNEKIESLRNEIRSLVNNKNGGTHG